MEKEQDKVKNMKIEIPDDGRSVPEVGSGRLSRQTSMTKTNCLCSPTTHPGSFRCRMHRTLSLQRTKSIDAATSTGPSTNGCLDLGISDEAMVEEVIRCHRRRMQKAPLLNRVEEVTEKNA